MFVVECCAQIIDVTESPHSQWHDQFVGLIPAGGIIEPLEPDRIRREGARLEIASGFIIHQCEKALEKGTIR